MDETATNSNFLFFLFLFLVMQVETKVSKQSMKFPPDSESVWQVYIKCHGSTRMTKKIPLRLADTGISAASLFRPGRREEFFVQLRPTFGTFKGIR